MTEPDQSDALVWCAAPVFGNMYLHCVRANRWLTHRELQHLVAWCWENIGPRGGLGCPADCLWMHSDTLDRFLFRHEADMVMFILRFTGSCD